MESMEFMTPTNLEKCKYLKFEMQLTPEILSPRKLWNA